MKVLAEESWSWMLFEHEDGRFLSVLCGTVGLYSIEFRLSEVEVEAIAAGGKSSIAELARDVVSRPLDYQSRHMPGFRSLSGYEEALADWRRDEVSSAANPT